MQESFNHEKDAIQSKLVTIGENLLKANELILDGLSACDKEKFLEARNFVKNIISKTDEIDNEIVQVLGLNTYEGEELRTLVAYLKITNEFVRASANTRSFIRGFAGICGQIDNSKIKDYTIPMQRSTIKAVRLALAMMSIDDSEELQECYDEIIIEESKTDDLYEMVEKNLFIQAAKSDEFEKFHKMLKALRKSEKIADRATSIANLLLYIKVGGNFHQV